TGLVVVPVLLALFAFRYLSGRASAMLLALAAVAIGLCFAASPGLRGAVGSMVTEIRDFDPSGARTRAGERLEFWRKSVDFVAAAPVIGHGTGSIADQFRRTVAGQTGMAAVASENPHNQTFAVAIQLGLVGVL